MYLECARDTKHPVSFAVSVPQIAPFLTYIKIAEIGPFTLLFNMAVQIPCQKKTNVFSSGPL